MTTAWQTCLAIDVQALDPDDAKVREAARMVAAGLPVFMKEKYKRLVVCPDRWLCIHPRFEQSLRELAQRCVPDTEIDWRPLETTPEDYYA